MEHDPKKEKAEYEAALAEVEELIDAKPGTPEGDRLDDLVTLIEAYEDKYYPITPPSKAEALEYFRETTDEDELEQLWLNMKNEWDDEEWEW